MGEMTKSQNITKMVTKHRSTEIRTVLYYVFSYIYDFCMNQDIDLLALLIVHVRIPDLHALVSSTFRRLTDRMTSVMLRKLTTMNMIVSLSRFSPGMSYYYFFLSLDVITWIWYRS